MLPSKGVEFGKFHLSIDIHCFAVAIGVTATAEFEFTSFTRHVAVVGGLPTGALILHLTVAADRNFSP